MQPGTESGMRVESGSGEEVESNRVRGNAGIKQWGVPLVWGQGRLVSLSLESARGICSGIS